MVTIKINNKEILTNSHGTILQACEEIGIQIPRFCYHDKLSVAGNCRMCLVQVSNAIKPIASCAVTVAEGMSIFTDTSVVKKAREGVMEFLLANHPLDCPICDQGGECDLQDQAMLFGNDRGRFYDLKRSVEDKNLGPLIKTIMTRCIHCTRCVRFSEELGGERELGMTGRGNYSEIGTYVEATLKSEVSGNIIDLCPVGALTSKPYAFSARPWELQRVETIDITDTMCSNINVYVSDERIFRILPVLHEEINEEWLSDRTRFSYDGFGKQRLIKPLLQKGGKLRGSTWKEILYFVAFNYGLCSSAKAVMLGGSLSLETMYGLKKLIESSNSVIFLENILVRRFIDYRKFYSFNAGYSSLAVSDLICFCGINLQKEMPLLLMRLRREQSLRKLMIYTFGFESFRGLSYYNCGNNLKYFVSFLEGKHKICSSILVSLSPMIVFGSSILQSLVRNSIIMATFKFLKEQLKEDCSNLKILELNISHIAVGELGINNTTLLWGGHNVKKWYHLGMTNGRSLLKNFSVYQNSHGTSKMSSSQALMPTPINFECESLILNGEGRVQISKKILEASTGVRLDYKVLLGLSNLYQEDKKNLIDIVGVREKLETLTGLSLNQKSYGNILTLSSVFFHYSSFLLLIDYYSNVYYGGGVSVFSEIMTSCLRNCSKIELKSNYQI